MKWKLAAALVCTCTFGVGEAGEIVCSVPGSEP
jgi:hypothetical protein